MPRSPLCSILLCVGALCAGAAGATGPQDERGDVAWEQPASERGAAATATRDLDLLLTGAPLLASGFDEAPVLRPLRFADSAQIGDSQPARAAALEVPGHALVAIPMLQRLAEAGLGTRPFSSQWYTSMHTESFPLVQLDRLGLFGSQQKYRTLRNSISVGFEAGAALRVRDHLSLTAGYRMLGYGLGEQSTLEGGRLDPTLTAPFLGVAFNY